MSFVISVAGVLCASLIYKASPTRRGLIISLVASALLSVLVAIGMNLIVTPAFSGVDIEAVLAMIVPILLPFNIIKFLLNSVIVALVFEPISKLLK